MIDRAAARLALVQRQRDHEWRTSSQLMREQSHDLRNLIQIVELAAAALAGHVGGDLAELVVELERVALTMKRQLDRRASGPGAPVGDAVRAALELVRPAVSAIVLSHQIGPATRTVLTAAEIEQVVLGLALDGAGDASSIELLVRERRIVDTPWVELVCAIESAPGELRAVRAIVEAAGGEVSTSDRRGGGTEIAVALPAV